MAKKSTNIDLSKFKHVSSDNKTTKLRHSDGHFLVISHKNVGKDFQTQLSALSNIGKEHQTADQANEQQDRPRYKQMAEGGAPKPVFSGAGGREAALWEGSAEKDKRLHNNIRPTEQSAGGDEAWPLPSQTPVGKEIQRKKDEESRKMYAEPTDVVSANDSAPQEQPKSPGLSEHIGQLVGRFGARAVQQALQPVVAVGQGAMKVADEGSKFASGLGKGVDEVLPEPQEQPQAQPQAMPEQAQPQEPQAQQPQAPQGQPQAQDPYGTDAYMRTMQQGLNTQQQGLEAQQAGTEQMGAARAAADMAYVKQMQHAQAQFQQQYQGNIQNIQHTIADIQANHINPKHYQENMSAGQKIATAIGMMAGGMGSGFTHQGNPAAQFFDKQIERDIDAQVKNQGNRANLLNAYHQQYQNMDQAMAMTRATLSANYAAQLAHAADSAATPMAKAAMLAKSGELQMKSADLAKQATMMKFMTQAGNPNEQANNGEYNEDAYRKAQSFLMLTNPEMAKSRAAAHVPGVGDAPAGTTIPDNVKQNIASHKTMNDLMNMSLQFSQQSIPKNPAELIRYQGRAKTIQNQLIGTIKQAQQDGVYKPSEAEYLLSQIGGSPGSLFADLSSIPKIKQLQESKQHEYNNLLSTYGLPTHQLPRTPDKDPLEGKTASDSNGTKLVRKNGKWIPLGK